MGSSRQRPEKGVVLKGGRDLVIRRKRHPWIYSQAIRETLGGLEGTEIVPVLNAGGATLGWGFHSPQSLIAVRMISFGPEPPAARWLEDRLDAAFAVRRSLTLDSDAFRLANAEGDYLPGLTVDVYAETSVVAIQVRGMEPLLGRVEAALTRLMPGGKVYLKRDEHHARVERLELPSGYVAGDGDGTTIITESGQKLLVDFAHGQKTGFYLDQRENRRLARLFAAGRKVLNLFSYTGGFALLALAGGASRVTSVESSRQAVEISRRNADLNPHLPNAALDWRQGDVFDYLEDAGMHDLIVADPPPFARRRTEVEGAISGYLSLNQQAMRLLNPGGYLFTFSCSGAVDRETFRRILEEAALRSGRTVRFLRELHADADHPVASTCPEGEYLKGWILHAQ